jgi:K+-transporting ATPase KdpF subunit
MPFDYILGILGSIVAVFLLGYLLYALARPERF